MQDMLDKAVSYDPAFQGHYQQQYTVHTCNEAYEAEARKKNSIYNSNKHLWKC